jgi:glutamate 5-kinase
MHAYESLLRDHDLHVAQLLLTHEDLGNPDRAERVRSTLQRLLEEYHQRWLQETGQA